MKKKKTKKSKIIKKVPEQEFLDVLDKITRKLIYKFKFGYHEVEDMKQQAAIFAIEALDKYDHKRPLENFLWTHVRNRLFNFKRDNYQRPDKPCLTCPLYDAKLKCSSSGCKEFSNKLDCSLYNNWIMRNETKKNLNKLNPVPEDYDISSKENIFDHISNKEIFNLIEDNLSYECREIYLKLKNGHKVLSNDLNKFKKEVHRIIENHEHTKKTRTT